MERLPNELREEILQYLQLQDIKSLRLASSFWAELAQPYLMPPTFVSLPHRDDFGRLLLLSQHRFFAQSIEKFELDMGDLNEYHARHNTFFVQYMRDPEDRDCESREAWAEYSELKRQKESLAHKYCALDLLETAFRNLPKLRAIDINLMRCPFQHPLLQKIWQIPTTKLLSRVSTTQWFLNIICAARHLCLDSLTHDCLPFEVWSQRGILENVPATFQCLRTLKVSLDYNVFPTDLHSSNSFRGFSLALCAAPNLETLHIGFANSTRPQLNLAEYMGEYAWQNLHTLGLEGMNIAEDDIVSFLIRHVATLKRVQLGAYKTSGYTERALNMQNIIRFRQGTLKGLLTHIREALKLEKLNMKGDMVDINSLTPYKYGPGLYDDEWVQAPDVAHSAAPALAAEQFILEKTEWDDAMFGFIPVPTALTETDMDG